ncbi:ATP-binding protein [Azospirillum sp. TSH100]|uniref:hybrid sensor histidine kinase/response regulator n=1 Tax=Azospirillum sp. TSH100 TaxID=652764 RepID=UPI000D68E785|nr:ATP-binding protein [Azospirillum sp. TSH100]QCG89043.1 response regulator [Azospirillum sp. TSH100]
MAVALPLVLFSSVLLLRNVTAQAEQAEWLVRDRVRLLAEDVDREVARHIAAVEVLATSESLAKNDLASFYQRAVEVRDRLGTNVVLRDLSNRQLVNSRLPWGAVLPVNAGFEVDHRAIETGRPQVSGLITSGVARPPLVFVVTPVIRDGVVRYLLSLTIAQERLQAILSPDRLPPDWVAGVLDGDGVIVARSRRTDQVVGTRLPGEVWERIRQLPDRIQHAANLEGEITLQAYARSQSSGWVVGASVPEEHVAAPARQALLLFAGGGTALFLISVGAVIVLARRLTHPFAELARAAEAVGAGDPVPPLAGGVIEINTVGGAIRNAADLIHRREVALRAAKAEADRANLAKSKFLAAASHDLRQPVQAMMLFQSALEERLGEHPAAPLLGSLGDAMGGLRMLLDSLLDVSKLDAGLIVPQPRDIQLGQLLDRLAAEYHLQAAARGLRLRVVRSGVTVRSDPALLERMVRNLIENALRYTECGGVLIGCRRQGGWVRIEVIDTGIGIEPDKQDEVFEEFIQVGNPERDRAKGLGLGLAVVRRLGHLLSHEITVRSTPATGSAFGIRVPMIAQSTTEPEQPKPGPVKGDKRHMILVIDDEPLVRTGLQAMLEGWGYRVLTAGSVTEAVSHVESGEWPSAILADYRLRGGETGLDAIRAVYRRLDMPVPAAVITGDTAPERLAEVRSGGHMLLHKPIAAQQLHDVVVEMVPAAE